MPVPSSINDLSTTAASNSPAGTDSPGVVDDHIRALAAFIAQLRDGKAATTDVVALTGDQTIAGTKTFSSPIAGSITGNAATATNATTAATCSGNAGGLVSGADLSGLTQFAKSIGASGYQKLPGGLIVQWGSQTVAAATVATYSWPIAFPNAARSIVVTLSQERTTSDACPSAMVVSGTQFSLSNAAGSSRTLAWIAIGN